MDIITFIVISLAILLFGLVSARLETTAVSPPMIFVAIGFLVSYWYLGLIEIDLENKAIHFIAELTLILVLFTDASRIDISIVKREHNIPIRLLLIGMPLTILLGAIIAKGMFPSLEGWECAVLAAILAPTDAALGQAVVSNKKVPVRIRQALNVESGLNDGIALPIILIFVSLASAFEETKPAAYWIKFASLQVILGPVVGVAVALAGGRLVEMCTRKMWMNRSFEVLSALGICVLAFATAELIGGNGFIAAFTSGLILGNYCKAVCGRLYNFAEAEGQLMTLLIFVIFGVVMVPIAMENLTLEVVLYSVLSLTVIRIIPVWISLARTKLKADTKLFLGWFGPRGIASILFALIVFEGMNLQGGHEILVVVIFTVLLSIFLHGITAYPLSMWYSRRVHSMKKDEPEMEELSEVSEMPVRIKFSEKVNDEEI